MDTLERIVTVTIHDVYIDWTLLIPFTMIGGAIWVLIHYGREEIRYIRAQRFLRKAASIAERRPALSPQTLPKP